jgi:hypothetical protein
MRSAVVLACAAVALLAVGFAAGSWDPPASKKVEAYCKYGAVSQAQLDGCIDHLTDDDVDSRNTRAAKYAKGTLRTCMDDAGPFCEGRRAAPTPPPVHGNDPQFDVQDYD